MKKTTLRCVGQPIGTELPRVTTVSSIPTTAGVEVQELYQTRHTRIVSGVCEVAGTVVYINVRDSRLSLPDEKFNQVVELKANGREFSTFRGLWDAVIAAHCNLGETCHADVLIHIGYTFAGVPIMQNTFRKWSGPRHVKGVGSIWQDYKKSVAERPAFAMYPMIEFSFF